MDANGKLDKIAKNRGSSDLPAIFDAWFRQRGWQPRSHQLTLMQLGLASRSALLVAPTGGLNVCDPAFETLFAGKQFHAWMMGREQVVPIAAKRLIPD